MTMPDTLEQRAAAALRRLAEAEEPTSHVARFPMLRKTCPDLWVVIKDNRPEKDWFGRVIPHLPPGTLLGENMAFIPSGVQAMQQHGPAGCMCRGLGWVPLTLAEVHLETVEAAADSADCDLGILYPGPTMLVLDRKARTGVGEQSRFVRDGANRVEAALRALDAAMEARG